MRGERENERTYETGWEAWDDVPRDHPAVFVLDTDLFDEHGEVHGAWLRVNQPYFAGQLKTLLGREPSGWAVVDQTGLGDTMLPEHFHPDELPTLLSELRSGAP